MLLTPLSAAWPQTPSSAQPPATVETSQRLSLRSGPSPDATPIGSLPAGTELTVVEVRSQWMRVQSGDIVGWANAADVTPTPTREAGTQFASNGVAYPYLASTSTTLNVREEPSTEATRVSVLPPRRQVLVTEEQDDWLRIESDDVSGWVAAEYLSAVGNSPERRVVASTGAATEPREQSPPTRRSPRSAPSSSNDLVSENSRLALELAEATGEIRLLQRSLTAAQTQIETLRDQLQQSSAEQQGLEEQLQQLRDERDAQWQADQPAADQTAGTDSAAEPKRNRGAERRLRRQVKQLEQQVEALEQAQAAALGQLADARSARDEAQANNQELDDRLVRLAEDFNTAQVTIESTEVELRRLQAENQSLQSVAQAQTAAAPSQTPPELTTEPSVLSPLQPLPADAGDEETAQAASLDPLQRAAEAVERWRAAWSAQDAVTYLTAYSPEYSTSEISPAAWRSARAAALRNEAPGEIELGTLSIQPLDDTNVSVTFSQTIRSGAASTQVRKTLLLELSERGEWLIIRESPTPQ